MTPLTDEQLVRGFESGEMPTDDFTHAAHVRVGWWYLRHAPLVIAISRFRATLQRYAAGKGRPERYHETITIVYMLLIAERLGSSRELTWDEFAARYPELLAWPSPLLRELYDEDVLASPRAKETFVLPEPSRSLP